MKGLNVKHDIDELRAGTEVILTLADSNIINKDDLNRTLNVNESEVMLENVTMSELENRMAVEKRKKRACQGVYNSYDDLEFTERATVEQKRSLLSQYDEENWTGQVSEGPKFIIGGGDAMVCAHKNVQRQVTGSRDRSKSPNADLRLMNNDYFTATEFANVNFRTNRKIYRKRKKVRMKETENDDNLKTVPSQILVGCGNKSNYNGSTSEAKLLTIEDGDDADLAQSLARARRVAQIRSENQSIDHGGKVANYIASQSTKDISVKQMGIDVTGGELENSVDADGRRYVNITSIFVHFVLQLNKRCFWL